MNIRNLIGLTALALAMGSAFAADGGLTRAQARENVIAARQAGALVPAGEAIAPFSAKSQGASTVTRAQVKADVLQARAAGQLVAAGPGSPEDRVYAQAIAASSTTTRSEVKEEVLAARANGELVPAGEGAMPPGERATHVAKSEGGNVFAIFHRNR